MNLEDQVTVDALLRGRVQVVQPRRGFRASLDPLLLAGFVASPRGAEASPLGHFLDIGCGTGALAFALLAWDPLATGVGVELQARLARCVRQGVVLNDCGSRFDLHEGDVVDWARSQEVARFDLVVTNPPFRRDHPRSPHPERSIAHHEVALTLAAWTSIGATLVKPSGRVAAIFEAARAEELFAALEVVGLRDLRSRLVLPHDGEAARRILVEAKPSGSVVRRHEPPLVVHSSSGIFTPEVARWLGHGEPGPSEPARRAR